MKCAFCCDQIADGDPLGLAVASRMYWFCPVHREMLLADPQFAARFADRIRALIARSEKTTAPAAVSAGTPAP